MGMNSGRGLPTTDSSVLEPHQLQNPMRCLQELYQPVVLEGSARSPSMNGAKNVPPPAHLVPPRTL